MRHVSIILCAAWIMILSLMPGQAQTRVALIIGNGAYKNVAALPNPTTDGRDVAASFARLGFAVTTLTDAGFDQMRRALLEFGRRARGAEMAVVYFAGHGMEVGGENWLIPIDAALRSDTDAENEAVSLRSVMLQVSGATKLGMVILDACRNNPFATKMQRTSRTRAVERGFARVEPTDNVLVAYAARDGTTATDGTGRNSPFTGALLRNIEKAGLEIRFLFATIRDDVMAATKREQQPFTYQSLSAQPIFLRAPNQAAVAVTSAPAQPSPVGGNAFRASDMSFFVTSVGLGKGGDLGGLAGADAHCQRLAIAAGVGNKTWRAYLSGPETPTAKGINARDRIGSGPWLNAKGVVVAQNIDDLHGAGNRLNRENSLTERGSTVPGVGEAPNWHDILTGSTADGRAFPGNMNMTCNNWSSSQFGSAMIGHSDRRGSSESWNSSHQSRGCSQADLVATGGNGLFYCFAQ